MTILIVKDAATNAIDVYTATDAQIDSFNSSELLPASVMGWPIHSPDDLAETSLYDTDLVKMCRQVNPSFNPDGEPTKRQLANIVFGSLARLAQPFDLTGADERFYPDPDERWISATGEVTRAVEKPRKRRNGNANRREPSDELKQCKAGSKQAILVDVFKDWCDVETAAEKVGWKASSIKSGLDYDLCTTKGYGWERREVNGKVEFRLLYPAGYDGPLPHK